jgi:hypothetical protein
VEFIGKPLGATQTEAKPASRRLAIIQVTLEVGNTWTLIFECEPDTLADTVVDALNPHRAATAVVERIPSQLTGGRNDFCLIDERKADVDRPGPNLLARLYDIVTRADF